MRKSINGIITLFCFICALIGAAGVDAQEPQAAIFMIVLGLVGITVEGFYWRRVYER